MSGLALALGALAWWAVDGWRKKRRGSTLTDDEALEYIKKHPPSHDEAAATLDKVIKGLVAQGTPREVISNLFAPLKEKMSMDDDRIYDIYIRECLRQNRFIARVEFIRLCATLASSGTLSQEEARIITEWLARLAKTPDEGKAPPPPPV